MRAFNGFLATATGIFAMAASAMAQPAPPVAPGVESTTVTENRILCVHQDARTGSRIGSKNVCHTMAEWRTIHANADQDMRTLQEHHDLGIQGAANAAGQ